MENILIEKIKSVLDNANWSFQYSGSSNYSDVENCAIPYLGKCKFSKKSISQVLTPNLYSEILELAREEKIKSIDIPHFFANYIADILAFERIRKYIWSYYNDRYRQKSKKWWIPETVSFHII